MKLSNVEIRKMIVPLLIEQFLSITIGAIDGMMVAGSGESVLSGVSLVGTLNAISYYIFGAAISGGSVVIAQAYGTGNNEKLTNAAKQLLWLAFLVAALIAVVAMIFHRQILNLAFGKVNGDVMESASIYFFIMLISYPISALSSGITTIMNVSGETKIPMKISLLTNALNITGNAILIIVLKLGAAGAAISSLISMCVGLAIRIGMVCSQKSKFYISGLFKYKPDYAVLRRICSIGIPGAVENGINQFARVLTTSIIAGFGTYQIAANSVCNTLINYLLIPGGAAGTVAGILAGRCIGAEDIDGARKYTNKLLRVGYVLIIITSFAMCLMSGVFTKLYSLTPQTAALTKKLFFLYCLGMCTVWPPSYMFARAFHAAGDVKYPMIISVADMWIVRIGLSYVLGVGMQMGIMGVWYAMLIDWVVKFLFYTVRYVRGTWLKKLKTEIKYK